MWRELYMELGRLSVWGIEPKPLYGRKASRLQAFAAPGRRHGFAATTAVVGWLMSASRCKCKPRRATYPTLTSDFQNISRSYLTFQPHDSGPLKDFLSVFTTPAMF